MKRLSFPGAGWCTTAVPPPSILQASGAGRPDPAPRLSMAAVAADLRRAMEALGLVELQLHPEPLPPPPPPPAGVCRPSLPIPASPLPQRC